MNIQIPASALDELELLNTSEWKVSGEELVDWINQIVDRFLPSEGPDSGRVSQTLSLRSLRHYQTLGCIDSPKRDGREVRYGYRQFLQALLIRKMLWQRVPADTFVPLLAGKSEAEYKSLLLEDIQVQLAPVTPQSESSAAQSIPVKWHRHSLTQGLEVHICPELFRPTKADISKLVQAFERTLRALC